MSFKNHTHCRVCYSDKLTPYIDLGNLPLSNNLCETAEEIAPTYPLKVLLCEECGLSQLSIVVDPELLFANYVYRSSMSNDFKNHCRKMAVDLKSEYGLTKDSFHIDIAGNDNALLREFVDEIGLKALNIDPARNLAEINAKDTDIRMFCTFWGIDAAKHLQNTHWPKADLITATNVIAHMDNLHEFFAAVTMVLKETGVLIIECPYIIPFIENNEFPTLYQEHLSIMSVGPIDRICNELGLTVMKVEKEDIHCGSIRVHVGYGARQQSVYDFISDEAWYRGEVPYRVFSIKSRDAIIDFRWRIEELNEMRCRVAAFAGSAKGNTLLNAAKITNENISYIVDHTPEKQGKFSPGTHIPIVPIEELKRNPPDYLIILAWNFEKEIMDKCRNEGYKGKFVVPIPTWRVIE